MNNASAALLMLRCSAIVRIYFTSAESIIPRVLCVFDITVIVFSSLAKRQYYYMIYSTLLNYDSSFDGCKGNEPAESVENLNYNLYSLL